MLPAGWSTEKETAAHQESSACMSETQILLSLQKHHQRDERLMSKLNFTHFPTRFPLVFQMCDSSRHCGHSPADLYGHLQLPDAYGSILSSSPEQQPPSPQNLLRPLQVNKHPQQWRTDVCTTEQVSMWSLFPSCLSPCSALFWWRASPKVWSLTPAPAIPPSSRRGSV